MAQVRYYGFLARSTGVREEVLPGDTVAQLLRAIRRRHGWAVSREARRCHILVDGRSAGQSRGFRTPVGPESRVEFLPVCGGG